MVLPEPANLQSSSAMLPTPLKKSLSMFTNGFLFVVGSLVAVSLFWSLVSPNPASFQVLITNPPTSANTINTFSNPTEHSFYEEPNLSYSVEVPVKDWDRKRGEWLMHHPSFAGRDKVLIVTGSQPSVCKNPVGDQLLLRFFKNKVDYSRIHGYSLFYNNVLLHPKMTAFWAKYPIVRAAMLAHPEAEWIWWVDSDAIFIDMDFTVPFHKYKDHNLVIHGWPALVYEKQSWVSINAGVFLIRNCQWSMEFMDVWVSMGPQSRNYEEWGEIQRSTFKDKMFPESDDQSALIYLLIKQKQKWADKIYLENEYDFQRYWLDIASEYETVNEENAETETKLRRKHAEIESERYYEGKSSKRMPLITHFTGCEPCSGDHNPAYSWEDCFNGMLKALNLADNQVLRKYGFVHQNLSDSSSVSPLP